MRHKEVKEFVQRYTANKCRSRDLNPGSLAPKPECAASG